MGKILFFLFIKPLSFLPFAILYRISDFFYLVIYYGIQYRKKVVFTNLRNSFPEKTETEILAIAKDFYSHFCDLMVEAVKLFSASEKELNKRCKVSNPELLTAYANQGKSLIIPTGHYNNWEIAASVLQKQLLHQPIALYTPLKSNFFNQQLLKSRTRFGLKLLSTKALKAGLAKMPDKLRAIVFLADQSPLMARAAYWTTFLNQETGVMVGTEKYAKQYDYPVVFGKMTKVKRGFYEIEFIPLEDNPKATVFGEITEKHTRILEAIIIKNPQYWLWSHKRWKRKKPVKKEYEH